MILSDDLIDAMLPQVKSYKRFDEKGLYIEVGPKGTKRWRLKYRFEKKEKRISFGTYPKVRLKEARIFRDNALDILKKKIDPSAARKSNSDRLKKLYEKKPTPKKTIKQILAKMPELTQRDFSDQYYNDKEKHDAKSFAKEAPIYVVTYSSLFVEQENYYINRIIYIQKDPRFKELSVKLCEKYSWEKEEVGAFAEAGAYAYRNYAFLKEKIQKTNHTNQGVSEAFSIIRSSIEFAKKEQLTLPEEAYSLSLLLKKAGYLGLSFFAGLNESETTMDRLFSVLERAFKGCEYPQDSIDIASAKKGHGEAKSEFVRAFQEALKLNVAKTIIENGRRRGTIQLMMLIGNILFQKKDPDISFSRHDIKNNLV